MEVDKLNLGIAGAIVEAARKTPDRPALTVDGETWSYRELLASARSLAAHLPPPSATESKPITAIMAHRHCSSYVGILAAFLSGHTYVPISVQQPDKRNLEALRRSGVQRVICGDLAADRLKSILSAGPELSEQLQIIHCADNKSEFTSAYGDATPVIRPMASASAYILFTSGSTGDPKGVPISHENLTGYLDAVGDIMDISPKDRFSQTFELTFDLSVHDLLVCWSNSAHLVVPSANDLTVPANYIREYEISCWFSVPSLAYQIQLQGHLRDNAFPSLRWSLFCGEALPSILARNWAAAAPASRVENWYGPTEATIACARFTLPPNDDTWSTQSDLTPIGKPFPGMELIICGDDLSPVADGIPGELFLKGRQVAQGYLADMEKSARSFVALPWQDGICYRTGDRATRGIDGNVQFLGRTDNQVKIRGYRVELGDIEAGIRKAVDGRNVIALSWPPGKASGTSVVAAVEGDITDVKSVIDASRNILPEYMVPSRIVCLPTFPTNASGKADRKAVAGDVEKILLHESSLAELAHLPPLAAKLMRSILVLNPNLSSAQIMGADTLMASGMDSLSFVSLTAELERVFGLTLEQEDVVALSEMSFDKIADVVNRSCQQSDGGKSKLLRLSKNPESEKPEPAPPLFSGNELIAPYITNARANRAIQFIERFPEFLRTCSTPIVLAVGSSGMFRGFAPQIFETVFLESGIKVRALNIGLPAISCTGISRICEFIRDCCEEAGVHVPLVIYELDPMHISVLPPKGDMNLGPEHFSGRIKSYANDLINKEFSWQIESGGAGEFDIEMMRKSQRPMWEGKREYEIAQTYLGDVPFNQDAVAAWLEGTKALSSITSRVIGFIHPPDPTMIHTAATHWHDHRYSTVLSDIKEKSNIQFIPWEYFELDQSDFLNINHVNPWSGNQKLTLQLAKKVLLANCD